ERTRRVFAGAVAARGHFCRRAVLLRSEGVSVSFSRKIPALPFPADLGAHNESIFWMGVRAHTEGGKGHRACVIATRSYFCKRIIAIFPATKATGLGFWANAAPMSGTPARTACASSQFPVDIRRE